MRKTIADRRFSPAGSIVSLRAVSFSEQDCLDDGTPGFRPLMTIHFKIPRTRRVSVQIPPGLFHPEVPTRQQLTAHPTSRL